MEGGRDDDGGGAGAGAAAGQERRRWRVDEEESSHGSSGGGGGGGGVELSLRLRTGAPDDDDDGAASAPPPLLPAVVPPTLEARRNMTIFYNGRVCAADVTEVQARAIISMASEETLQLAADHRRRQRRQQLMRGDGDDCRRHQQDGDGDCSSSSSSAAVARQCARDRGLVRPAAAAVALAPSLLLAAGGVGSPRQGFAGAVAAPVVDEAASGLSMKRSLQLFLQKRKARTAAAVAPPYARQGQAVRR